VAKGEARVLKGPPDTLTAAALSPDGKSLAMTGQQGTVFLWDLATGRERHEPVGHRGRVLFLAFSGDGRRVLTTGGDGTFWVWDAVSGRPLHKTLPAATAFAFSAAGRLAATRKVEGDVGLREPDTGKELHHLKGTKSAITCGALSADGRTLAVVRYDGSIQVWDAVKGRQRRPITAKTGQLFSVSLSPDGAVLAGVDVEGTLRVWEVASGAELWQAAMPNERASKVAFSPDGRYLATGGSLGVARVWEAATGKQVRQFPGHNGYIMSPVFSPDGRSLAVGSWMAVRLWDLPSGKPRGEHRCHRGDVMSLAFSPDGRTLATGGTDSAGVLWDVADIFTAAPERAVPTDLEAKWTDLAGDAEKGYQAVWDLAAAPAEAAKLLGKHLRPVPTADAKRVKALIEQLDAEEFDDRKRAAEELEKLGEAAVPALREALKGAKDVDLRLRLGVLINHATAVMPVGERLRALRAMQALELAGTREAEAVLKALASGAAEARLTAEAKAALARLRARAGVSP
jgi:WD40 repeat protein